jgi:glycosyltransferase involved in cell wall biosynthesis
MTNNPERKKEENIAGEHNKGEKSEKPSGKKRLLIATDNFLPRWDGVARFLSEIIPRLKDTYDISVLAPDFGPYDAGWGDAVRVVKFPVNTFRVGDFNPAKVNYRIIKREVKRADVIFSQTIGPIGFLTIRAARRNKKKVISYIHSIEWELVTRAIGLSLLKKYMSILTKGIVRQIYKKPNLLIVPAESIGEMLSWQKINTKKKVVHLGVDTKKFIPPANKAEAKKKIGLDSDVFIIGHHGRLGREKDLPTLLRAFIIVKKTYPKTILLIIGEGVESIKKKLVKVEGVILPGATNNVVPYLQAMDLYCLPSLTETTSLATLEAMACGVPVIATKVGFVRDYIKPQKNGLFFKERNSYDLARQIMFLIREETLRKKISLEARKTVEKEFNWDKTAREIEETIDEMIKEKN